MAAAVLCSALALVQPARADSLPAPPGVGPGSAERGARIVASRQQGLCVLCHAVPAALGVPAHTQGNLAPPLDGAGSRLSPGQLRARIVDSRRINPHTIMPPYGAGQGTASAASTDPGSPTLNRVGQAWQGKPVLDAQQIEDVVAYLASLK